MKTRTRVIFLGAILISLSLLVHPVVISQLTSQSGDSIRNATAQETENITVVTGQNLGTILKNQT